MHHCQKLENMRFSNHQYMRKTFQCLQKKLGRSAIDATILNGRNSECEMPGIFADSVLCVGRMEQGPRAAERRWKGQVGDLRMYSSYHDAVGLDGESIEFECKKFARISTLSILQGIQKDLEEKNIQPEYLEDRIIFMSKFTDILWKSDDQNCISNAENVKNYAKKFLPRHWTFVGPGSKKRWFGDSRSTRTVGPHSQQNGTAIERNWSSLSSPVPAL